VSVRGLAAILLGGLLPLAAGCDSWEQPGFEVRIPFAVKYATPAAGHVVTRDVAANLSIFAAFSAPLDQGSIGEVKLLRGGAPLEITVRVGVRPYELVVDHGELEVGDYELVLPAGLRSTDGDSLGIELRIPFRVEPSPTLEL
jgi:hypothetical protein